MTTQKVDENTKESKEGKKENDKMDNEEMNEEEFNSSKEENKKASREMSAAVNTSGACALVLSVHFKFVNSIKNLPTEFQSNIIDIL